MTPCPHWRSSFSCWRLYCSPNKPNFFAGFFFLDDADSDEDGGDGYDFDVGHDRAFDLGAGNEIGGNVDQDDVSAVEVANMFCLILKSAGRQCALVYDFFCSSVLNSC